MNVLPGIEHETNEELCASISKLLTHIVNWVMFRISEWDGLGTLFRNSDRREDRHIFLATSRLTSQR